MPLTICLVIDTSGSMDSRAPPPDAAEDEGYSVLDVVKHSACTVIQSMGPGDHLAVVRFSSTATLVLDVTEMTAVGQEAATAAVRQLRAAGGTALWPGLELAVRTLRGHREAASVLLLTDGQPNEDPPGGAVGRLRTLVQEQGNAGLPRIHTFGFGYDTDRTVLDQLARLGRGFYGFIPDSGMIGTVFVSAAAWLRHPPRIPLPPATPAARRFTEAVAHLSARRDEGTLVPVRAALEKLASTTDSSAAAFLENWDDQVAKAISREDWYRRWGQDYLLSLARAVELQISANFRDPAGRPFETPAFLAERERVEDIFLQLPPMRPSLRPPGRHTAAAHAAPTMHSYMDRWGGCFVGSLRSRSRCGSGGRVKALPSSGLRRGDVVWALHPTAGWGWAEVELIMRSRPGPAVLEAVDGGCLITPWHPVLDEPAAQWRFPNQWTTRFREHRRQERVEWVYSVVLRPPPGEATRPVGVLVGGTTVCATLAHGNREDEVLGHAFFGTEEITAELERGARSTPSGVATVSAFLRSGLGERAAGGDRIIGLAFEQNVAL